MALQRYLDHIEAQLRNDAPPHAVEYQGQLDEEALSRAFELLCARHPVLRARIRLDDQGYLLYVPADHHPQLIVLDGDVATLKDVTNRASDSQHALTEIILIRGQSRGYVALRTNHAIADGASKFAMFGELWRLYTDIINGAEIAIDSNPSLPSPPTELLKERWAGIHTIPAPQPMDIPERPIISEVIGRHVHLSEEDTARLLTAARDHKTSVHAIVCGAIVVTLRALGTPTAPAPMEVVSAINLRKLVAPPVGATETTNFLSGHKATVNVSLNGHHLSTGREIKAQLDTAIAHRELVPLDLTPVFFSAVETPLEQHLARCSVSNHGVIPPFAHPTELVITDFVRPRERETPVSFPRYGVYTYGGRLNIGCSYPARFFTEEEVDQHIKKFRELLCNTIEP